MGRPRIIYTPRPDTTSAGEVSTLAAAYRFILDCQVKKEGGPPTAPDDEKKKPNHGAAETNSSPYLP